MRAALFGWLLAAGCGESMTSIDVVHDVGRLCVAHVDCSNGGSCAERVAFEANNMRSAWGQAAVPALLAAEPMDWEPVRAAVAASGAGRSAPSCSGLVR